MRDELSKAEISKDALQDGVTAASHAVGSVALIVTTAVVDIARAVGGFANELFAIRDAARRAGQDHIQVVPSEVVTETGPAAPAGDQPKDI